MIKPHSELPLFKKTYTGQNVNKIKITGSAGWNVIADNHYVELCGSSSITESFINNWVLNHRK